MECIKYHFKPGCLEKEDSEYDIELIRLILNNTKGLRMYSRFGAFYNEEALNFNNLKKEPDDFEPEDVEEVIKASAEGVEERLINPFTLEPATKADYCIVICKPDCLKYYAADSVIPHEPYAYNDSHLQRMPQGLDLKLILKLYAMSNGKSKLEIEAEQSFINP
jgi:hypothetical protein